MTNYVQLYYVRLIWEGILLDITGIPTIPPEGQLLQYRGTIFRVLGSILNVDDTCYDIHIELFDAPDINIASLN